MKRTLLLLASIAAWAACGDGTGPADGRTVSLSFTGQRPATAAPGSPARAATADTITGGGNTLIITRAQLVLREIELERADRDTACDSLATSDDGCEEFEAGPVLIDLPLTGGVQTLVAVPIPLGVYDEIEFEIHKVSSGDPEDAAFRQAHPDFVDISIRVQGTFNGQPFVFTSDLNVDQEFELFPPLVVDDTTTSTNVTVLVDLSTWFVVGGTLVNPELGNKGRDFESEIKENIKRSIEAFEDRDKDGDESD